MEASETPKRKKRTVTKPYEKHKTEKKLTIKQYLNQNVKSYDTSMGVPRYPIYLRITFNGQVAQLRSATEITMTIDEYKISQLKNAIEIYKSSPEYEFELNNLINLTREKEFLKFFIEKAYENSQGKNRIDYLRKQEEFNLTNVLKNFNFFDYSLDRYVSSQLTHIIWNYEYSERIENFIKEGGKVEYSQESGNGLTDYEMICSEAPPIDTVVPMGTSVHIDPYLYLLTMEEYNEDYKRVKDMFSTYVWLFSVHFWDFCNAFWPEFGFLPITIVDYKTGFFAEKFREYGIHQNQPEKYEAILNELRSLIDESIKE